MALQKTVQFFILLIHDHIHHHLHIIFAIVSSNHPIPKGFSSLLLKPYIKLLTHSEKVGWWKTLMVECVSIS